MSSHHGGGMPVRYRLPTLDTQRPTGRTALNRKFDRHRPVASSAPIQRAAWSRPSA